MANNRLYIRCKVCGKRYFVGKHYNDGWYTDKTYDDYFNKKAVDFFNDIFNEHYECFHKVVDGEHLEMVTENALYERENELKLDEYIPVSWLLEQIKKNYQEQIHHLKLGLILLLCHHEHYNLYSY